MLLEILTRAPDVYYSNLVIVLSNALLAPVSVTFTIVTSSFRKLWKWLIIESLDRVNKSESV